MTDIKLGDRVRYTGRSYISDGVLAKDAEGIVLEVNASVTWKYRVFFPSVSENYMARQIEVFGLLCSTDELEVVNV